MKNAAYESLAREMNIADLNTVADVKQKIKNLRGTYKQELAKIKKSVHSGAGGDEVYSPSMKWFSLMDSFVRQLQERRSTDSNLVSNFHKIFIHMPLLRIHKNTFI